MKKLNLGCGKFKKKGYVNVDIDKRTGADIIHNLDEIPYPFEDNEFDLIEADHVLEHLKDPFKIIKELYRITKKKGKIVIRVPHFSRGFTHPDHKRGFDVSFPYYFNPLFKGGYTGTELKLERIKFTWNAQPYLKKTLFPFYIYYPTRAIGIVIDFFANLSPMICSRIWCFWVGGFEEIEFIFEK
ncbi:class I SAM-dependent methyltransferase [Candidatus Micrarchaeota archaeon]|nr:class I SAM-dependent methyltransferase [Candidatus Micrarchaeota archaeon]